MFFKRLFHRLVLFLIMVAFLCIGVQIAICQDPAGTWLDSATKLLWSVKDNGSDMSWDHANNYCENLDLGGQTDWRLPTLDELNTIFDKSLSKQLKVKGPIELGAGNVWSGTLNSSGDAWSLSFFNGGTTISPTRGGCGGSGRALCVHK